ncbi:MAG: 23S rRNA (pseudouridine(1915)-N(3))-methyltransferase RlmH [Peptostreptococcaceae bacterium]|nr:23S rRNA (pseudouridine(1915)-N(3))-methyltransferase RlmH [Peptostreptococcaceae bacterium]
MNIRVICIGKLKEKYWVDAVGEYSKRLTKYCNLTIEELKEDSLFEEGENILKRIKKETFVITLEISGNTLGSEALAEKIETLGMEGKSDITFIIGGSTGLSEEVGRRSDFKLSFSKMTFPHQMMRVILLEQVYRSFKIIKGETYHK